MDKAFVPFMDAAYQSDLARFDALLLEQPSIVSLGSSVSHPSLLQFIAVEGGLGKIPKAAEFARATIGAGASLNAPFVAAASVNARELVDLFIDAGVATEACAPWTALEEALYWAHQEMGHYLVTAHGAHVRSLRAAAALGRIDLMAAFFAPSGELRPEAGPVRFPFGNDVSGEAADVLDQALLLALKNQQYDAAQLLIDKGANVNAIPPGNHEQCTTLHQAVYKNDLQMIDWLIDRGAVATIADPRFSATAVGWARHFGHESLAVYIGKQFETPT